MVSDERSINFGGHTQRFAYFGSLNGNRSDHGLQTPIGQVFHDGENGYGGFGTFIYNLNPKDQFRLVTSLRADYYQVPFDPNPNSPFNQSVGFETASMKMMDTHHSPGFAPSIRTCYLRFHLSSITTPRTIGAHQLTPQSATDNRTSNYGGLQTTFTANVARNNIEAGVYGFGQHDQEFFGLIFNDGSGNPSILSPETATGGLVAGFVSDSFKPTSWLTLIAGMRPTHFSSSGSNAQAGVSENTINPRFGVALQVPHLNWVFRAFYGHYYQAPPLTAISGPLLEFIQSGSQLSFASLKGERDEEHQFGVTIPIRGWTLDADNFQTRANNCFDHNNIGESNIFIPVTIDGALIRGWELTLRSPRLWNRGQVHLAYSNQVAQARGAITGGLICFPPASPMCQPPPGYGPLDHDQRNTLNVGFNANLPWHAFASSNVYYGSGFTNGMPNAQFPGPYLPGHTTFDVSLGKSFGEKYTVSLTALNVANRRVLLDNSLTFGGFHFNDPREIYVEFRYRFHY